MVYGAPDLFRFKSPDRCYTRCQLFSGDDGGVNKLTRGFVSFVAMIFIFGLAKKYAFFVEKR